MRCDHKVGARPQLPVSSHTFSSVRYHAFLDSPHQRALRQERLQAAAQRAAGPVKRRKRRAGLVLNQASDAPGLVVNKAAAPNRRGHEQPHVAVRDVNAPLEMAAAAATAAQAAERLAARLHSAGAPPKAPSQLAQERPGEPSATRVTEQATTHIVDLPHRDVAGHDPAAEGSAPAARRAMNTPRAVQPGVLQRPHVTRSIQQRAPAAVVSNRQATAGSNCSGRADGGVSALDCAGNDDPSEGEASTAPNLWPGLEADSGLCNTNATPLHR